MTDATPVIIPLINPNEPEALILAIYVEEGQNVSLGDLLCTIETTKSAADLEAEAAGYVIGLKAQAGKTIRAGETLCYLATSASWMPPEDEQASQSAEPSNTADQPAGLRITRPALILAQQHKLDLARLPIGPLITEKVVQEMIETAREPEFTVPESAFDPTVILIYGGGGHGKSVIELLMALRCYQVAGIIDDNLTSGEQIFGFPVLGNQELLASLHTQGMRLAANAVGGVGKVEMRIKIFRILAQAGFVCPALVHPTAFIEHSAILAPGVQVFPHAYVGSQTQVGFGTIINTNAVVSHECVIGNYVNISPGALLAGILHIGDGVLIGMGATVNLGVRIGAGTRIGNGATIKSDVPPGSIVRAGATWPK